MSRKESSLDLPRWCGRCTTNGYHAPEHCPERPAPVVTDEMIERGARALYGPEIGQLERDDVEVVLRAALEVTDDQ